MYNIGDIISNVAILVYGVRWTPELLEGGII